MPWVDLAPTLLHAWYGGQETGNAMADVLFGKITPSGRLSMTFPKRLEDTPTFLNFGKGQREVMYGEGIFIGYRYYDKLRIPPIFYFGHGLSYTTFVYSNLQIPKQVLLGPHSPSFTISVTIQNSGPREGAEVVQVYVQDLECSFDRPCKELKAFVKVHIQPGQTTTVNISLDKYALSYWNDEHEKWLAEKGTFRITIGRSADPEDEIISQELELEEDFLWNGL